jgi:hypothetical protein
MASSFDPTSLPSIRAAARSRPRQGATDARRQAARDRLIGLTRLLDSAIAIPGLRTRIGLDALLGLIPGVGDLVSGALGLLLIREARILGASRWLQARMLMNLLVDATAGSVPLAGDLFDVYFKAHERNLRLLHKELGEPWLDGDVAARQAGTRRD